MVPVVDKEEFVDLIGAATAGMGKRDPTAYGIELEGTQYRFGDTPLNQFTFSLKHEMEKIGKGDGDVYPILIRLMFLQASFKWMPESYFRSGEVLVEVLWAAAVCPLRYDQEGFMRKDLERVIAEELSDGWEK